MEAKQINIGDFIKARRNHAGETAGVVIKTYKNYVVTKYVRISEGMYEILDMERKVTRAFVTEVFQSPEAAGFTKA